MMPESNNDVSGAAALAICESLLVYALGIERLLPEKEIIGVMEDAIAAHRNAPADDGMTKTHEAVASLIQSIIDGGNSVRRPH